MGSDFSYNSVVVCNFASALSAKDNAIASANAGFSQSQLLVDIFYVEGEAVGQSANDTAVTFAVRRAAESKSYHKPNMGWVNLPKQQDSRGYF